WFPAATSCVPSGVNNSPTKEVWVGASSRAYSLPVSGATSRTTPGPSSTASTLLSGEKAKDPPPTCGPSRQEPTSQRRQPPPVVTSQRPSGLKPTHEPPHTGRSRTSFPLVPSQTLTKTLVRLWLPVATQRPFGLTAQKRTSHCGPRGMG